MHHASPRPRHCGVPHPAAAGDRMTSRTSRMQSMKSGSQGLLIALLLSMLLGGVRQAQSHTGSQSAAIERRDLQSTASSKRLLTRAPDTEDDETSSSDADGLCAEPRTQVLPITESATAFDTGTSYTYTRSLPYHARAPPADVRPRRIETIRFTAARVGKLTRPAAATLGANRADQCLSPHHNSPASR